MTMTHDERRQMALTPNKRLLRVAELMDTVPPETFTLRTWSVRPAAAAVNFDSDSADLYKRRLRDTMRFRAERRQTIMAELLSAGHCGFAGCAVGHAAQDPVLQAEGLGASTTHGGFTPRCDNDNGTATNWAAVEVFFDLTEDEAHRLFMLESYSEDHEHDNVFDSWRDPHPHQVAARIREFVASRSAA